MRDREYLKFRERLDEILESRASLPLPNIKEVEDPQEALNVISRTSAKLNMTVDQPYEIRVETFDPPKNGMQTHSRAWHPKVFLNGRGMGGRFDGSGVLLCNVDNKNRVFTFALCEHVWDESGANHNRGWHPAVCTKCGFDASIDSGD